MLPKDIRTEEKFEQFCKKHSTQFPGAIGKITESNYAFVCFSSFGVIADYQIICKRNNLDFITLNNLRSTKKNTFSIKPLIKYQDIYWKNCAHFPLVTFDCLSWKFVVVIIFIVLMIFFTTPAIIINFLLTNSPFVKELFGTHYEYSPQKFWIYVLQQFAPPLIVLGVNRFIYFIIFRSVQREKKLRLSRYHLKIQHVTFLYVFINSIILPGIAVPAGSNLITMIFGDEPVQISNLVKNFYGYTNINFFITMMIQKIFLSMFNVLTLVGIIIHYRFSPSMFLFLKKIFPLNFYWIMLRESATFNFGYYYSLNMIVFAISIIYSSHTPIITVIGVIYLFQRLLFDTHLLLNVM